MALQCTGLLSFDGRNRPICDGDWIQVDTSLAAIDRLGELLELLFVFDAEMFFYVLAAEIVFFIKGKATGLLAKLLSRT